MKIWLIIINGELDLLPKSNLEIVRKTKRACYIPDLLKTKKVIQNTYWIMSLSAYWKDIHKTEEKTSFDIFSRMMMLILTLIITLEL